MPDPSVLFLLHKIAVDPILLIVQIGVNVHLAHIVKEIEIEVFHSQFLQLPLEDFLHLTPIGRVIAGELGSHIETIPRVSGQGFAHDQF